VVYFHETQDEFLAILSLPWCRFLDILTGALHLRFFSRPSSFHFFLFEFRPGLSGHYIERVRFFFVVGFFPSVYRTNFP